LEDANHSSIKIKSGILFKTLLIVGVVITVVLLIVLAFWGYSTYKENNPNTTVITVGDARITNDDISKTVSKYAKMYEYDKNKIALANPEKAAASILTERAIIDQESKKRGIIAVKKT